MELEARFNQIRMTAACVELDRAQVDELIIIAARLVDERRRIRVCLAQLPESFAEVRGVLNELSRTVSG